ncbi:hypothetical protein [Aquipuribacter sp. SD81]|uniref:hypothetical protein n=1 Tax=Aquipuribacter sp. SD81 TaxID=3127703 RepID=UPI00301669E3
MPRARRRPRAAPLPATPHRSGDPVLDEARTAVAALYALDGTSSLLRAFTARHGHAEDAVAALRSAHREQTTATGLSVSSAAWQHAVRDLSDP